MKLFATIGLACCLLTCLGAPLFASSSVESTTAGIGWLATALEQISVERMLEDIRTLSGPAYGGRLTGSAQDEASAIFVANRFSELRLHRTPGLVPENRTNPLPQREWKQTASVSTRRITGQSLVELVTPRERLALTSGSQFLPVLDSPSADVRGPVVFVGYGIVDSSQGIDDYAGLDVRNAIVLFLRGKPETHAKHISHAEKERLAKQHGAIGYLTTTGPMLSPYEQRRGVAGAPSAYYSATANDDQLPGAWISTETAEWIFAHATSEGTTLRSLQESLNRSPGSRSMRTNAAVEMKWTSVAETGTLFNVLSVIRGYAPTNDEAVLLGAHRDHFGQQAGLLFPGADDNASGTAVMLEVARVLALSPAAPKRSVLFLSFSGEEQGLLGSRLYVTQPIVPLAKTIGMINVDHAGIGNGRLTVGVAGFEKSTAQHIGELTGLADQLDVFGYFPGGDHVPFKEAGVPTLTVVSSGVHPHFHRPSDTAETVKPEILRAVARYVLALTWQLANQP
ncbi:MAG TPA: M28 family peptidase [Nitrospira sp.]|nr:M28 family peptidase [Nitrospira sp.]